MNFFRKLQNLPLRLSRFLGRPLDFEEQIYSALVQKGDIVYDIGASVGAVSLYLSRLVGPSGKVVAFEPNWASYQGLCANLRRRRRACSPIIPVPYGLSNASGTQSIQVPDGNFGMASIASSEKWATTQMGAKITSYECSFVALDAFAAARSLELPQFMKIDVEGAELLLFQGASRTLAAQPLMLIEIFAPWERAFDYTPWSVLSLLWQNGYRFLFACPEGLIEHEPSEQRPFPPEYERGYNVIAYVPSVHAERLQRLESLRADRPGKILNMPPPPQPNVIIPLSDG